MYSMERSRQDGVPLLVSFYLRRFFRIYPLSILAVLTAVALHLDSGIHGIAGLSHAPQPAAGRILSNLLLVQNVVKSGSIINVLWSLPYEVQMYIFLPFLFMRVRKGRGATRLVLILWVIFVIVAVGRNLLLAGTAPPYVVRRLSLLQYVPNFLPGIIAFTIPPVQRIRSSLWLPFILLLVTAFVLWPTPAMGWALCLLLGFAVPVFAEITTGWLRRLSHRIATYSYGIYLSHQFCIWLVVEPLGSLSLPIRIFVLIVLLISIPIVLYHLVEKPLINVGGKLADCWHTRLAPAPVLP
jgi:peptidoglycan/LPS O-acetylase OafA/YrhL